MHGTAARPTSTTERVNSTYHQQVDTAHLPKQPFTSKHCSVPTGTPMDTTKIIAMTLTHAIQKIRQENQTSQGSHGEALHKLAK